MAKKERLNTELTERYEKEAFLGKRKICRVTSKGTNIFYVTEGEGIPVILLHGNGENHFIFDALITRLAKSGYKAVAIDTRGHGMSGDADELHYTDMADDVFSVCLQEKLKDAVLYGFSDGGITALLFAQKYPGILKRMIVSGVNLNPQGYANKFRLILKLGLFFSPRNKYLKLMATEPDISEAMLKKISVPVLLTHAEKDIVKYYHSEYIAMTLPSGIFRFVPREDHDSYVTNNEKLFSLIKDFLPRPAI